MVRNSGRILGSGSAERKRELLILLILIVLILITAVISCGFGRYSIEISRIPGLIRNYITGNITDDNKKDITILMIARIPRICLSVLVGASLSVSGAAYQGLFQNPMVSPDILGVSAGASVGAALALLLRLPSGFVHILAFVFATGAVLLVVMLARIIGGGNGKILIMVLAGTVISSVFQAFTSLMKYVADTEDQLPAITYWLMGSFARSGNADNIRIMFFVCILCITPLMALRWSINALSFGEEEAASLGVNVRRTRNVIIACSTLLTASSVCICGTIGWVGLIMPHITRFLVGPNYRALLPTSMLMGGLFMLVVDNFSRVIIPGELPIGILTSLIGAPLFVYLLIRGRKDLK